MNLAKPRVDIGLNTNKLDAMLAFWQGEMGVPFDHVLPIRKGQGAAPPRPAGLGAQDQPFRGSAAGHAALGYAKVQIARPGHSDMRICVDTGRHGRGRGAAGHARHRTDRHQAESAGPRNAPSVLCRSPRPRRSPARARRGIPGRRDRAAARRIRRRARRRAVPGQGLPLHHLPGLPLRHGARPYPGTWRARGDEATTLGTTARISMVRDPDGNWIEISQRASITGSLAVR